MGCAAMPDRQVLELTPLVYEISTDCEAQLINGRVYITWIDTRPEGLVAVGKNVVPADHLDRVIERLLMVRALRDAERRQRDH